MKTDKILKLKLVKIWEILSQETDEENPMGTTEILQKLHAMGIDCDRRTLYADIDALNACGYEILCRRSTSNMYYVMDRKFSVGEIRFHCLETTISCGKTKPPWGVPKNIGKE